MPALFGIRSRSSRTRRGGFLASLILLLASAVTVTMERLLVGVESMVLSSPSTTTRHYSPVNHHHGQQQQKQRRSNYGEMTAATMSTITSLSALPSCSPDLFAVSRPIPIQQYSSTPLPKRLGTNKGSSTVKRHVSRHRSSRVLLRSSGNNDNNDIDNDNESASVNVDKLMEYIGLACQPVVWVSLYSVATTGGGLPAGPGGLIGAIEGLSYLVVVALALLPSTTTANDQEQKKDVDNYDETDSPTSAAIGAKNLSRVTIVLGLIILAGLVANQGCVPNAKPILDYSAYLPICSSE